VQVLHIFGDHLWEAGERLQPPKKEHPNAVATNSQEGQSSSSNQENDLAAEDKVTDEVVTKATVDDNDELKEDDIKADVSHLSIAVTSNANFQISISNQDITSENEISSAVFDNPPSEEDTIAAAESENVVEKMNSLLRGCFFTALKVKLKDKELPIPTGTFYRQGACYSLVKL